MTTGNTSGGNQPDTGQMLREVLERLTRIERRLRAGSQGEPGPKTEASVALVALRMAAGEDLSQIDQFWTDAARREIERRAAERERVVQAAATALVSRRTHPVRARQLAIAVLTVAEHPAITDLLLRSTPVDSGPDQAAAG